MYYAVKFRVIESFETANNVQVSTFRNIGSQKATEAPQNATNHLHMTNQ
jgi:hypothetical protein